LRFVGLAAKLLVPDVVVQLVPQVVGEGGDLDLDLGRALGELIGHRQRATLGRQVDVNRVVVLLSLPKFRLADRVVRLGERALDRVNDDLLVFEEVDQDPRRREIVQRGRQGFVEV